MASEPGYPPVSASSNDEEERTGQCFVIEVRPTPLDFGLDLMQVLRVCMGSENKSSQMAELPPSTTVIMENGYPSRSAEKRLQKYRARRAFQ